MDSNTHHNFRNEQHQLQQPNSALLRFRSAPGSLFTNFTESSVDKANSEFESERLISRFMNCGGGNSESVSPRFQEFEQKSPRTEVGINYMSSQQGFSGLPPHYPRQNSSTSSSLMNGSYGLVDSMKPVNSNLASQSSSPAQFFSHLSAQNGYATMKSVGNYGGMNDTNGEVSPSTNRLNRKISFSTRLPSSLGMLSQISEIGSESIGARSPDDVKLGNGNNDTQFYGSGYAYGSWNDSSNFSEIFTGMKRDELDNDGKLFSGTQNGELGNRVHVLSHHLSLPKTTSEMAVMKKFLQFQDSVPCKIRAKRGCATHPRSIAERVRRTRISERMRKLQEVVPSMDKQTNTADMLDLAVDYIKDLQKQFKTLTENRANCKCLGMLKQLPNQIV